MDTLHGMIDSSEQSWWTIHIIEYSLLTFVLFFERNSNGTFCLVLIIFGGITSRTYIISDNIRHLPTFCHFCELWHNRQAIIKLYIEFRHILIQINAILANTGVVVISVRRKKVYGEKNWDNLDWMFPSSRVHKPETICIDFSTSGQCYGPRCMSVHLNKFERVQVACVFVCLVFACFFCFSFVSSADKFSF